MSDALSTATDAVCGVDGEGCITFANPAMSRLLGQRVDRLLGAQLHALSHHSYADGTPYPFLACPVSATLADGQSRRVAGAVFWRSDGSPLAVDYTVSPLLRGAATKGPAPAAVVVLRVRPSGRPGLDHRLQQTTYDELTGLPNRTLLRQRVDAAVEDAVARQHAVALLLVDLDAFTDVNDLLGPAAGDSVLRQLAERLVAVVAPGDTVARLGGDEFAICLAGSATEVEGVGVAGEVIRSLRSPFWFAEVDVPLSVSIGIVVSPVHGQDASTLLRHADVAMHRAKAERSGWALYDTGIDAARAERLALIGALRRGIAGGELALHYQPVVELRSGRTVGVEALVRWRHPTRGLLPPGEFVGLAEQTGLIGELTEWVVRAAVDQARCWQRRGLRLPVAVNLSRAALGDAALAARVTSALAASDGVVSAEVTESALADEPTRSVLVDLTAADVTCAVDDFGTGYSSPADLRTLPVSQLKIDRAFVCDLAHDDRDVAIVRSVVDLARTLHLDVVAEGVESADVAERLVQVGVPFAQGFLFSRPLAADELTAWVTSRAARWRR